MPNKVKQRPVEILRDGSLKAAIWKNRSDKGTFYTVTFSRSYRNRQGNLRTTDSFSGEQLLALARLAGEAHAYTVRLTNAINL